jgi:hypothetical protein
MTLRAMTTLRGGTRPAPVTGIRLSARSVTIALAAALAITLTALVIVLATSGGGAEPVRVAPTSGPIPPSPAERDQPPGLNGPGFRP